VGVRRSGEVEQVSLLGLVELQGAGKGDEHGLRRAGEVAAFEAGVVIHADPASIATSSRRSPLTRRFVP
jgi:hypothetical protein